MFTQLRGDSVELAIESPNRSHDIRRLARRMGNVQLERSGVVGGLLGDFTARMNATVPEWPKLRAENERRNATANLAADPLLGNKQLIGSCLQCTCQSG
ncbi:hypothetical protein ACVMAJ_006962 [Bradyrhizobium sp. USDA 4448]